MYNCIYALVDFLNVLLDARCRPSPQAVGGQPEADVLVAVLFAQVVSQLLETFSTSSISSFPLIIHCQIKKTIRISIYHNLIFFMKWIFMNEFLNEFLIFFMKWIMKWIEPDTCPIGEQVLHRQRPTTGSFLRRNFHPVRNSSPHRQFYTWCIIIYQK